MSVNLSEIMNRKEQIHNIEVPIEFAEYVHSGITYPVKEKSAVRLELCSPDAKIVQIKANASMVLGALCDCCLKEVTLPFEISFEEEVDFTKSGEERAEELDETYYIAGYDLDVEQLIRQELMLEFPSKILCKEDCKGLCRICGADLNKGECGCDRTSLDPRMAAIQDIFNKFKEV